MQRCLCVPPKAVSCSGKGWKVLCLFLLEFYAFADKTLCLNLLLLSWWFLRQRFFQTCCVPSSIPVMKGFLVACQKNMYFLLCGFGFGLLQRLFACRYPRASASDKQSDRSKEDICLRFFVFEFAMTGRLLLCYSCIPARNDHHIKEYHRVSTGVDDFRLCIWPWCKEAKLVDEDAAGDQQGRWFSQMVSNHKHHFCA